MVWKVATINLIKGYDIMPRPSVQRKLDQQAQAEKVVTIIKWIMLAMLLVCLQIVIDSPAYQALIAG